MRIFAGVSRERAWNDSGVVKDDVFTARCYAERGYATVCRLSVCLSVRLWKGEKN